MTLDATNGHAAHSWFDVEDDCIVIAGRKLSDIAADIGRTPFYVYDHGMMTRKVEMLRAALPREVHLHYAMKANPMPEVAHHFVGLVDGLEVASCGELAVGLAAGGDPETISFAGPGKTDAELRRAAEAGITVNAESEREIRVLAEIGRETSHPPRVAIRVNPDFELKTSGMKMGDGPKQFGIDAERVPQVLPDLAGLPIEFRGFHIYSGSQNLRSEAIVEAQRKTVELAIRLSAHAPTPTNPEDGPVFPSGSKRPSSTNDLVQRKPAGQMRLATGIPAAADALSTPKLRRLIVVLARTDAEAPSARHQI